MRFVHIIENWPMGTFVAFNKKSGLADALVGS